MAKVTSKLQVTLPKAIADRVGIRPGDDIEWRADGRTIQIVPAATPLRTREERLASFDEATARQDDRNRDWRRRHRRQPASAAREWSRNELYTRGRAR
jgi:AbrB family looped-hinge helix DNA binding protein